MNDKMSVLEKLAPELSPRYTVTNIGNSNLFADYYRDIARYVPERKMWYTFTSRLWEPDIGNLQAMELCKKAGRRTGHLCPLSPMGVTVMSTAKRSSAGRFVTTGRLF